jgi:hypothetical protein
MNSQERIESLFKKFGKELADDLRYSEIEALKKGGRRNPNATTLTFEPKTKSTPDGNVVLDIVANDKYWRWIESGRRAGARKIPADVVGKTWQNQNGIDPRVIILSIQARRKRLTSTPRLAKSKSSLDYNKSAKQLSFIIQRSIFKKGIKPKPFVDKVLNDGRLATFKNELIPVMGEQFKLIIKGLE